MFIVYAETRSDRIARYLKETPETWPFMDRVLLWLAPTFREDIERYHAGNGPSMRDRFDERQLETLDRLLERQLESIIEMPAPSSLQALEEQLRTLREENRRLAQELNPRIRVSQKGGVSVYGLGRYPVTLYRDQWLRLLELEEDIREFIRENSDQLSKRSRDDGPEHPS
jgi:hypothetical protein